MYTTTSRVVSMYVVVCEYILVIIILILQCYVMIGYRIERYIPIAILFLSSEYDRRSFTTVGEEMNELAPKYCEYQLI